MSLPHYVPNPMARVPASMKPLSPLSLQTKETEDDSCGHYPDIFVDVDLCSPESGDTSSSGLEEFVASYGLGTFQIDEPTRRGALLSVGELALSVQFGEHSDDQMVIIIGIHSAENFPAYHGLTQFSRQHTKVHLEMSISFEKALQPVRLMSHAVPASTSMKFDENLVAIMGNAMFQRRRTLQISVVEKKFTGKSVLGTVDIDVSRLSAGHRINTNNYSVFNHRGSLKLSVPPASAKGSLSASVGAQSSPGSLQHLSKKTRKERNKSRGSSGSLV
ncbi:uncharacterized protein LOC135816905 isoform X1 [Sycon ciliatum]|uniref:uncharacterized protein LOC135816905 isoform X1 n=1 Tax=Sycon ciliatum TaxID=27933 RepID=UPI0031F628D6